MEFNFTAAIDIAKRAHGDQKRKYTNEPYISHSFSVAGMVAAVTNDDDMVIAAILHDVVEDTPVKIETISGIFGPKVADMVSDLTDVSRPEDGNRATRKALDREHTAMASYKAKTIKLADLIDNTKSIVGFDPKFAAVYMAEKKLLLKVLTEGDKQLFEVANWLVEDYFSSI